MSIRNFRKYMEKYPLNEAISRCLKEWSSAPYIKKPILDLSNVDSWPSPWDLFSFNAFDKESMILGAFYTLLLSKKHGKSIRLGIASDNVEGMSLHVIDKYEDDSTFSSILSVKDFKNKGIEI